MARESAADPSWSASASLLIEGDTCWRKARARRASVLIDAADYFDALRDSLLRARRSVFILGWEFNSRTCLCSNDRPVDGAPREIGKLLKRILRRNRELEVWLSRSRERAPRSRVKPNPRCKTCLRGRRSWK